MGNRSTETDYIKRLNRVFQFIDENLNAHLSLDVLAKEAHFSPFHFHRIFKTIVGETVNEYITRKRVEKAAKWLIHKPALSISEISNLLGFNSISVFSRTFKKIYQQSPSAFRTANEGTLSKIRQVDSKIGQYQSDLEKYICAIDNLKQWTNMNSQIEIKSLKQQEVAAITCIGPQNLEGAFERLNNWAKPKGLINDEAAFMTIYHDSMKVTDYEKVRVSAGLLSNGTIDAEGEINLVPIAAGKYVVGKYEIGMEEFEKAWTGLFLWLNDNGYQPLDASPFEVYYNDYREHPERKFVVDFHIPIKG